MNKQRGSSGPGILGWIIVLLIVAGCLGLGPCAEACYCGGPKLTINGGK